MRKLIIALLAILTVTLTMAGTANAGTYSGPNAPAGWHITYAHNFATTPGLADWVVQPGANAAVTVSTRRGAEYGLGITLTKAAQWAEVVSSKAVIGPDSFVQGLIFIPKAANGTTGNWPAFWSSNQPWPSSGEDDILEGIRGSSCFHTHYGPTAAKEINSPSLCGKPGTGWITVTALRENGRVTVWYNGVKLGSEPLPPTANEKLMFQTQSQSTGPQAQSNCPQCFGPLTVPSTAWLSRVTVYAP